MNLYIIGNGFDLAHGLSTSFSSFRRYMEQQFKDSVERWGKIVNIELDENWSNLEESFDHVDYDYIIELCSPFLHSYDVENWSDSYHFDYQYEISKYLDLILNSNMYLRQWLKDAYSKCLKKFKLEGNSIYLTFNYTNLLEDVYKIGKDNICHIHGDICSNDKLILGHSNMNILSELEEKLSDDDVRISEGKEILNTSKHDSYKNSEILINKNINFFQKCRNIQKIWIIGHSPDAIANVDFKYYEKISSLVNKNNVITNVVIYDEKDIEKYNCLLNNFGLKNINFLTYSDIKI